MFRKLTQHSGMLVIVLVAAMATTTQAAAQDLDEVIIIDTTNDAGKFDEGVARQCLDLLNSNGEPQTAGGNLLPMVSGLPPLSWTG